MADKNRQVLLARNPSGEFSADDFQLRETAIPTPGHGEFLVRNLYLSLDPANRLWAAPVATYVPPVGLGEVMRGFTVSEVVQSNHPDFAAGDIVQGMDGWQDYAVSNGVNYNDTGQVDTWKMTGIQKAGLPLTTGLSVLGTTGLTAYYGLLCLGEPQDGDTVLISAAAGAVGSIVGQLARIKGARAVGTAGSDEKCKLLRDTFGFDGAINYKTENLAEAFGRHCLDGVNVYFDNVGGDTLDTALTHLAMGARVILCGAVSQYTTAEQGVQGPSNYAFVIFKRAVVHGFVVLDHYVQWRARMQTDLIGWLQDGQLQYREEVVDGLENAGEAINRLYRGQNMGKLIVRIADQ